MSSAKNLPYSEWKSALTADQIFSGSLKFSEITTDSETLYWLEQRPSEKGRSVVMSRTAEGLETCQTPSGMSVRTKVHEYGGGAYTVSQGTVYFVNDSDQRIYAYKTGMKSAIALTPARNADGSLGKYAALTCSPDGKFLVFVYEKEFPLETKREHENYLGILQTIGKEPGILAKGRDFYADPCFSPDGKQLAWLEWNHPHMPWNDTSLMLAEFNSGKMRNAKRIAGGEGSSVCWPQFSPDGRLMFAMDFPCKDEKDPKNYWNLYAYDSDVRALTEECAEFGSPHWMFGAHTFTFIDGAIVAACVEKDLEKLVRVEKDIETLATDYFPGRCNIAAWQGKVIFGGASPKKGHALVSIDPKTGNTEILKEGGSHPLLPKEISVARPVSFETSDKKKGHAFLYLPKNNAYKPPVDEVPGVIVMAHGGPTSRASSVFSPIVQYFTSSGYAVLDVNYRGSSGYGRAFRDALYTHWGELDIQDCADGVSYLISKELIDPAKVAVRGGSAGGYVVQCCLVMHPQLFKAGASYYGIGSLKTLIETTHKFEKWDTQRLIGGSPNEIPDVCAVRSPLLHLDKLSSPLILFQGEEDKIVPPSCSREVAEALKKKGLKYAYFEYKGEGHGFRSKEANVDSLEKEIGFYREVFSKDFYKAEKTKAA